jgi:hypothetical protein
LGTPLVNIPFITMHSNNKNVFSRKVNNIRPEQRDQFSQLFTAQQLADKLKQDVFALAAPLAPHLTREQLEELLQSEEYTRYVD